MFDIKFIDFVYCTLSPLPTTPRNIFSHLSHCIYSSIEWKSPQNTQLQCIYVQCLPTKQQQNTKIRHECLISITFLLSPTLSHPARKNGNATAGSQVRIDSEHNLQEYTYKKITPCDVCSQVLRGECRVDLVMSRIKCLFTLRSGSSLNGAKF